MTRPSSRRRSAMSALGGRALLGAALASAVPASPSDAGPIRGHRRPVQARVQASGGFYAGGPSAWASARAPKIPRGMALAAASGVGASADSSLRGYLLWRRGLNAARFDRNHPGLGPMLASQSVSPPPDLPPVSLPQAVLPREPEPLGPPRNPQQQNIPEPSAAAIALAMLGWGAWRRRALRRRAGDSA